MAIRKALKTITVPLETIKDTSETIRAPLETIRVPLEANVAQPDICNGRATHPEPPPP